MVGQRACQISFWSFTAPCSPSAAKALPCAAARWAFFDLPEPLLAFQRGEGAGALACIFNLSPQAQSLKAEGLGAPLPPSQGARLDGGALHLAPNGFALLPLAGAGPLKLTA